MPDEGRTALEEKPLRLEPIPASHRRKGAGNGLASGRKAGETTVISIVDR
jgi:hypothetical protein